MTDETVTEERPTAFVDLFRWAEERLVREARPVSAEALVEALEVESTKDLAWDADVQKRLTRFRHMNRPRRVRKAQLYLRDSPPA